MVLLLMALNDSDHPQRAEAARWVLVHVLDGVLRLLHPLMPFITEELWQKIPGHEGSIMTQPYPEVSTEPPPK